MRGLQRCLPQTMSLQLTQSASPNETCCQIAAIRCQGQKHKAADEKILHLH